MKLQTLINIYTVLNRSIFADVLEPPRFFATRSDCHAQYDANIPAIEFNTREIKGIRHATAIVYHEMIHQYVEEYLGLEESDHHGPIFWRNYLLFAPKNIELGECL